jgi:Cof subfamily protein (haloacid dehalogenase superfamily)
VGRFKAIFSDVDGTLLSSAATILPKTRRIVKRVHESGVPFIPVSARMPRTMKPLLEEIGIRSPLICYSGALTLDDLGKMVGSVELAAPAAAGIYRYVRREFPGVNCSVYRCDDWVVDSRTAPWVEAECAIVKMEPVVRDIEEYLAEAGSVHKVFCMGTPEETDRLYTGLCGLRGDISPVKSKIKYIEITAAGVSKSVAIRDFCDMKGMLPGETMAFGDHYNDIDMLELVGLGVAMGNAPCAVRDAAACVTASNDEEGIYLALRDLFFREGAEENG